MAGFEKLMEDSKNGISRIIKSRRGEKIITPEEFSIIVKSYFLNLPKKGNYKFIFEENDRDNLLFILRYHYQLWLEVWNNQIEIFRAFPKEFQIIKEVNKSNHPHTPKTFKKGTKMYYNSSIFSTSNWLNGIPLWDNKNEEVGNGLKPSCQINYNYIRVDML
jgi:hypothetical protein